MTQREESSAGCHRDRVRRRMRRRTASAQFAAARDGAAPRRRRRHPDARSGRRLRHRRHGLSSRRFSTRWCATATATSSSNRISRQVWESSPDATTFTFHLRHDARFSDGRAVTSEDFRYGVERVLESRDALQGDGVLPRHRGRGGFHRASRGARERNRNARPRTIIFHLSAPDPIFAHKLAMPFASAVPREVAEKWGDDFSRHVVGSGAFMLREWIGGQRLVLVRNPYYFNKRCPISTRSSRRSASTPSCNGCVSKRAKSMLWSRFRPPNFPT